MFYTNQHYKQTIETLKILIFRLQHCDFNIKKESLLPLNIYTSTNSKFHIFDHCVLFFGALNLFDKFKV